MNAYTLTLIDVRRVQQYLFNANELKQNLGASAVVEQAITEWLEKFLPRPHNLTVNDFRIELDSAKTIEDNGLSAEVIFVGGGNAAILFSSHPKAEAFTRNYTRHLLLNAPGLECAVGHVKDVNWNKSGALKEAWNTLQAEVMPKRKGGRMVSQSLLGLGVTAECAYTGLPAVAEELGENNQGVLVSAEVFAKRDARKLANKRLNKLVPAEPPFEYPEDFDHLGGEHGQARYIAVVHADGNSMGNRIKEYIAPKSDNREIVKKMRLFSEGMNGIGLESMKAVGDRLLIKLQLEGEKMFIADKWRGEDAVTYSDGKLPLRPIVFGGDDVTFVCDGRLGLALAVEFLKAFSQQELPDGDKGYACAGVAIVHSHYPFARAYALAEDLCREAKKEAREKDEQARVSLINWHYASSGLTLDWDDIRQREYQDGNLLLRPLIVDQAPDVSTSDWRTWNVFLKQIQGFRQDWPGGRGKLKDLRDALRQGETAVSQFVSLNGPLPDIAVSGLEDARNTGWHSGQCVYFDALEADDLFIYPQEVIP